jgi:elongation factor G
VLFNLSHEDPSISVKVDEENSQILVSGLGELHLEILRDRIELDYGISTELGPMRVAYRESVSEYTEHELELQKTIGGAHMYAKLRIGIESTIGEIDVA